MSVFRPVNKGYVDTAASTRTMISLSSSHADILDLRDKGELVMRIWNPGPVDIGIDPGFADSSNSIYDYLGIPANSVHFVVIPKERGSVGVLSAGADQDYSYAFGVMEQLNP